MKWNLQFAQSLFLNINIIIVYYIEQNVPINIIIFMLYEYYTYNIRLSRTAIIIIVVR